MSKSDYLRPSATQIDNVYRCGVCGSERDHPSVYVPPNCCGREMSQLGESYPASSDEWEEERDTCDGEWRRRDGR